jgi:hypothetical protein
VASLSDLPRHTHTSAFARIEACLHQDYIFRCRPRQATSVLHEQFAVSLDFICGFLLNDPRRSPCATLLLPGQVRLQPPHCNFFRNVRDLPAHRRPARRAAAPPLPAAEPVFARPCRVTPALAHAFQRCSRHLSSGRPAFALQRAACCSLPHAPPRRAPPSPVRHRAHAHAAPAQRPRSRVHASAPPNRSRSAAPPAPPTSARAPHSRLRSAAPAEPALSVTLCSWTLRADTCPAPHASSPPRRTPVSPCTALLSLHALQSSVCCPCAWPPARQYTPLAARSRATRARACPASALR